MPRSSRACKAGRPARWRRSGPKRSPELPDVPTVSEAGVPNFDVTSWNALYAPAGTPQPIIDKLNGALREVLADPDLKKRALDLGIDAKGSTPDGNGCADALRYRQVGQGDRKRAHSQTIEPKRNRRPPISGDRRRGIAPLVVT